MPFESKEEKEKEKEEPIIKHMVMSSGGAMGLSFYGTLRESHKKGLWKHENIETIYGSSVGTIIAVVISLGYDWNVIDDFLIKRPWQNVFKFQLPMAFNVITKQGLFNVDTVHNIFLPLFKGKDIPIDITLLDFYHLTKREIHFIATELNTMCIEDISYKTHPEWKVMDAIYASACLPVFFTPLYIPNSNKIFIDGGILLHYPLNLCLAAGHSPQEIMGIYRKNTPQEQQLQPTNTIFEIFYVLITKLLSKIEEPISNQTIRYNIPIEKMAYNIYTYLYNFIHYEETRKDLIQIGVDALEKQDTDTIVII